MIDIGQTTTTSSSQDIGDEGFLGLNVEKAAKDINNFDSYSRAVTNSLIGSFASLYGVLNSSWASPIADEFTKVNINDIMSMGEKMLLTIDDIFMGAVAAAKSLAAANGSSFPLSPSAHGSDKLNYTLYPCKDNMNGTTGMKIEVVKQALDDFETNVRGALDQLASVPDGIAFYDPEGTVIGGYQNSIVKFKNEFEELASFTATKLKGFIEDEQHKLEVAKREATNALNSN